MLIAVVQFLVCAAVIVGAGTVLTRSADAIAELTRLGRLLVGSILLAGATSLPELSVGVSAARHGWVDLTAGNLLGAGLFNLLTLSIMDLTHHSRGRMLSRTSAAHALSAMVSMGLVAVASMGVLMSRQGLDFVFLGLGSWTWAIILGYALGVRMIFYDQQVSAQAAGKPDIAPTTAAPPTTLLRAVAFFAIAAAAIVVAAPYLTDAAERIAELSGLGRTFVGTTLVALCTTLPELVATFTALRLGAFDLAVGNVFGSNAFNVLLLAPVDLAYTAGSGSLWSAVSATHTFTGLAVILITAVVVMGQLYQVEKRTRFIEPDAMLVIVLVMAALGVVYRLGQL